MKTIGGGVTAPQGYQAGGTSCGIKKEQQLDLAVIVSEVPAKAAGIFTTNKVQAAPVLLTKKNLAVEPEKIRGIIINSGNANACNGEAGMNAAQEMAVLLSERLQTKAKNILVASTGVIGEALPVAKIKDCLAKESLSFISKSGSDQAAKGIMTSDTFAKSFAVETTLADGKVVTMGGIAKGSGMIHPNMATMLAFVTTDIAISQPLLQKAVQTAGEKSFNRISVDGDTSTNDCLLVLANGLAKNREITTVTDPDYQLFLAALTKVCQELAKMMARDGEGATKLVGIQVEGAQDETAAVLIAKAVANSNLVKTALFGNDANWGRIMMAVGNAGVVINPQQIDIYLGDLLVCQKGSCFLFDEAKATKILSQKEVQIKIDLHQGSGSALVWTCDLSYDYVKINGSYRT